MVQTDKSDGERGTCDKRLDLQTFSLSIYSEKMFRVGEEHSRLAPVYTTLQRTSQLPGITGFLKIKMPKKCQSSCIPVHVSQCLVSTLHLVLAC